MGSLLAKKADVNAKNKDKLTPLHRAVAGGHRAVTDLLLANKADVNAKGIYGWTPLHWAAHEGREEVTELLLANKSDVNARDENGATPLHTAIQFKNKDEERLRQINVAVYLLCSGADVNAKTTGGGTPCTLPRTRATKQWWNYCWQTRPMSIQRTATARRLCTG